jgi:hypothetical protein
MTTQDIALESEVLLAINSSPVPMTLNAMREAIAKAGWTDDVSPGAVDRVIRALIQKGEIVETTGWNGRAYESTLHHKLRNNPASYD